MQKYQKRATQQRIANLKSSMKNCKTAKDPQKCQALIKKDITRLKSKLHENFSLVEDLDIQGYSRELAASYIEKAHDLTIQEKEIAIELLEYFDDFETGQILSEAAGDDDIANYYKHRNKMRKIGLRKGVKSPVQGKATKVAKAAKGAAVKKKTMGQKIASKLVAYAKKKGLWSKAAKGVKLAGKTM